MVTWPTAAVVLPALLLWCGLADVGGFPCGQGEWIVDTWRPSNGTPECRSCWSDCTLGQYCHPRGGCRDCASGEYDVDGDPTRRCVSCPAGKTSDEGATECSGMGVWVRLGGFLADHGFEILGS